jgi:hypothetical protein
MHSLFKNPRVQLAVGRGRRLHEARCFLVSFGPGLLPQTAVFLMARHMGPITENVPAAPVDVALEWLRSPRLRGAGQIRQLQPLPSMYSVSLVPD